MPERQNKTKQTNKTLLKIEQIAMGIYVAIKKGMVNIKRTFLPELQRISFHSARVVITEMPKSKSNELRQVSRIDQIIVINTEGLNIAARIIIIRLIKTLKVDRIIAGIIDIVISKQENPLAPKSP